METVVIYGRPLQLRTERRHVDHLRLNPDNPRLRHELLLGKAPLTEKELEDTIWSMDRTKKLYQTVLGSGGIQNPLYILGNDEVVEGNRREVVARKLRDNLAAGQFDDKISKVVSDIISNIPVKVLPSDITIKEIDVLLAREHISGKYPWSAVDQAEHIYRMYNQDGFTIEQIAEVSEKSRPWVYQKLTTYEWTKDYLKKHPRANILDYSFFEELYKKRATLKKTANFDPADPRDTDLFHSLVSSGKIPMAIKVRQLPEILADADAKKILQSNGIDQAWLAVQTKNPAINSSTFQALSDATEALQRIPRNEYLEIPRDPAKKRLVFGLYNELQKLVKDLKLS